MEYFAHLDDDSIDALKKACGVEVETLDVTENGSYTAEKGKAYNKVNVSVESSGGGDFEKITVTNQYGATIYVIGLTEDGGVETEIANNDSAEIICGKVSLGNTTVIPVPLLISTSSVVQGFTPTTWRTADTSVGIIDVVFALETISEPGVDCFEYIICQPNANIVVIEATVD